MAAKRRLGATGVLPDEMVWEILTWLPTKSLMRFKAVSKLWLSAILDPDFARAHRAPFRGLLVMSPDPSPTPAWSVPTRDFFVANLDDAINGGKSDNSCELKFSFQFRIPEDLRSFQASNLLNGIICLFNRNVAKLCNIATREIINLPESKCDYRYCTYHLGLDPIQSVYKILKICPIYEFYFEEEDEYANPNDYMEAYSEHDNDFMEGDFNLVSIECEILTLGVDSSWRSIHPPPNGIIPHGLCVDGVLYWMTMVPGGDYALYSFNLARENFQSICDPNRADRIRGWNRFDGHTLLQFGTSPVLAFYSDVDNNKHTIMVRHYREGSWTEISKYTIEPIPSSGYIETMTIRGLLPNGNWVMCSSLGLISGKPIYLFDEERNYIQTFTVRFPASELGRIWWYQDNIISVKRLTGFQDLI